MPPLPPIVNHKTVVPGDPSTPEVLRLAAGPPSLVRAERLVVRGDMTSGASTAVSGVGEVMT